MTDVASQDTRRASFTSFQDSTADDWMLIASQIDTTQALVADHAMMLLRALDNDHGGFPVSRLEHSLQTATRAERGGEDDEYVIAALLHDIGDTLLPGLAHPQIAAAMLKGHVPDSYHWMVAHHATFQGYYYFHHLGLDRDLREEFRDSPHFELTEHFCAEYDSLAFDPDYDSEPLEHFESRLRDVLGPKHVDLSELDEG